MAHLNEKHTITDNVSTNRTRLPNLWEVLSRQTRAPVDLYSFYIYMRDTQRSVDYLDFWLDVSQHMSLCRHYVRGLRRSVLIDTPEAGSQRSSALLHHDPTTQIHPPLPTATNFASTTPGKSFMDFDNDPSGGDQRLSAYLREQRRAARHSPTHSKGSTDREPADSLHNPPKANFTTVGQESHMSTGSSPFRIDDNNAGVGAGSTTPGTHNQVSRSDIKASAEKILYTYLLSGSEREIILPVRILEQITTAIERDGRDDPEVFDAAKDYVFQAMERDAFPGFLRQKALGNIVQPSMIVRLIIGLISLFAAFWTAFILVFLGYDRKTRCWLILPFTIAVYFLASHQYMLDPILALFGFSEYTFLHLQRIREPFVRKLLNRRALSCSVVILLVTAALCCLFIFVPSKHI